MSPREIRELRKEMGLTMKEFGEILGVGPSTVSMWETGDRTPDMRIQAMLHKLRERVNNEGGRPVAEALLEIAGSVAGAVGFTLLLESLFGRTDNDEE